jgi:hypothetical protein
MIAALLGEVGSPLRLQERTVRQRTPFGLQDARTWLRLTAMPSAWAAAGQGVQGPLGRLLLVGGHQAPIRLATQPTGRVAGNQGR